MLYKGFTEGFIVPSFMEKGCKIVKNLKSVDTLKDVVQDKINTEISEQRIAGSFDDMSSVEYASFEDVLPLIRKLCG